MSLFTKLSLENAKTLADELGLHPVELDRLNFNIHYTYNEQDDHSGYEFQLVGDNPMEIIEKLPDLENNVILFSASLFGENDEDWYNYQYDTFGTPEANLEVFLSELKSLSRLNDVKLESNPLTSILKRQIYIGIVGSMETYLSDTFIDLVYSDHKYLRKFVETYPEFSKRKFEMKDVFETYSTLGDTARNVMLDVIYHDLVKVREMYVKTFDIEFPILREPIKCVKIRHDLVHRNGKTKGQRFITINKDSITEALDIVKKFVNELAVKICQLNDAMDDLPF
jgi:hypothetical protein